jgi:hypothetical protein
MNDSFVNQIYYYCVKLENALKLLEVSEKISVEDKKTVLEFIEHLRGQGVSTGRLAKYLFHLMVG